MNVVAAVGRLHIELTLSRWLYCCSSTLSIGVSEAQPLLPCIPLDQSMLILYALLQSKVAVYLENGQSRCERSVGVAVGEISDDTWQNKTWSSVNRLAR